MKDYMLKALIEAKKAELEGEIPVGAVVVKDGEVIAEGRNRRETHNNALGHAEIEAINNACEKLGRWRLDDCELYVTLEPCPMCAGAIINARLKKVAFGAFDKKAGSCSSDSVVNLFELPYNHKPEVWAGICEDECAEALTSFFEKLREKENG